MQKNFYIFLFVILVITSELTSVYGQWTGWAYRRTIAVDNNSGSTLTDFQVKISLNSSNFTFAHAKSDGSDLRITSSDGITELPFWIESWNAVDAQANIWVKVPSIPNTGTTIYLYYGNTSATASSNGTNTFNFFDDFSTYDVSGQNWIRRLEYISSNWGPSYVPHDWKYVSEMQQGALYYAIERVQNGWSIESLDAQIEQEFNYIHSQINPNGTVIADSYLTAEPQYCYGLILSNLSLGYLYFKTINPTLSTRCYNDMVLVFNYLRVTYPNVSTVTDLGGFGWLLVGYSNAWKAFTDYGNTTSASQAVTLVQSYTTTFISNQDGSGYWNGVSGIQENLKRNFGMLKAYDVTGNSSYLTAVKNNIDYILANHWISSNGGLEWYADPGASDHFYECHQQWFMIAVKMLYDKSGGAYDYLTQGLAAWHFLTDNNYTNIDMYVHNYVNHNAFFSYRQITSGGTIQADSWKGSYEIGTALWGMALNYNWVSNYQSSHSAQAYNYLDMMVKQIKNTPTNRGYFTPGTFYPSSTIWSRVGSPNATIIQDNGNNVLSLIGGAEHFVYIASIAKSFNNFIFETKVNITYDLNNSCTPEIAFRYSNNDNTYITMLRGEAQNDLFIRRYQGGVQTNTTYPTYNFTANHYYKYKISASNTILIQYLDDTLVRTWNDVGSGISSGGIGLGNYGDNSHPVYYDDVRIRSYATVEPTATVGNEIANPLPVELSSFSASIIGSSVKLNWRTETEVNNYGFEIERKVGSGQSSVGNFEKIGFVNGNGNSNSPKSYSFEDNGLTPGEYSYRIKQIDNDGQFEYSKTIEVDFNSPKLFELSQNYPNPFNPKTTIRFSIPEAGNVKISLYNPLGQEVSTILNEVRESGTHIVNFDASELNSGMYIYKLESGSFIQTRKMILLK
ncbi:MAG TPA: hypothetical protein DHV28_08195 [Ignavibacteriales bacterium]|nr:hypothetical protein [Ignavibacteriales bacterium]